MIIVPPGYRWDENQHILIPDFGAVSPGCPENPGISDFATFRDDSFTSENSDDWSKHWQTYSVRHEKHMPGGRWTVPGEYCVETFREKWCLRKDGTEFPMKQVLEIQNPGAVYVHKYRDDLYKVVTAVEPPDFTPADDDNKKSKPDDVRWYSNLARARIAIEEYALCNDWRYFVTLTIDGEKLSRDDLEAFRKKLNQMIRNLRRNSDADFSFLLVPELHPTQLKKGAVAWHMHGLMNLPEQFLELFENRPIYGKNRDQFPPRYIRVKIRNGIPLYHWKHYDRAFGYNIAEPVKNRDASARYLMKYVSKEQSTTAQHLNKGQHLYFVSRGLKKAEKVAPELLAEVQGHAKETFTKHCETCVVTWYYL